MRIMEKSHGKLLNDDGEPPAGKLAGRPDASIMQLLWKSSAARVCCAVLGLSSCPSWQSHHLVFYVRLYIRITIALHGK